MVNDQALTGQSLVREYKIASFVNRLLEYFDKVQPGSALEAKAVDLEPLRVRLLALRDREIDHSPGVIAHELASLSAALRVAIEEIAELESRIDASSLRQFVTRVGRHDLKLLTALLNFYRLLGEHHEWTPEHTDKVDFLLGVMGQNVSLVELGERLKEIRDLRPAEGAEVEAKDVLDGTARVRAFKERANQIKTLADLQSEGGLVAYRSLKHELGRLLFEPAISLLVVGTNAEFKRAIDPLLEQAETKLREGLESVASELNHHDLPEMNAQLVQLHDDVAKLEVAKETEDIRVSVITDVSDKLRSLAVQLQSQATSEDESNEVETLHSENQLLRAAVSELTLELQRLKGELRERRSRASVPSSIVELVC